MKNHYQLSDNEFEVNFQKSKFDPKLFNHDAHIRLAWIHVTKYGIDQAIINVETQLINYVTLLGAQDKYNKTVTIAAVKAVHHFVQKSKSNTFSDFIAEFPRLSRSFKELLSQHYSIDIYNSDIAKSSFLEPNLIPFS